MPCFGKTRFTVWIYYRHESSIKTPYAVQRLAWLLLSLVSPTWRTSGGCWVIVTSVPLYNIGRIRCYLSKSAAEQLVHAFITSKLDYCNALLCCVPSLLTQKLQRIQNAAARIITRTSRLAHITPVLFSLHWLPVCQRIKFKVLVIVFRAKCGRLASLPP